MKKIYEKCGLETSSRLFLIFKGSSAKETWGGQFAYLGKFWQFR